MRGIKVGIGAMMIGLLLAPGCEKKHNVPALKITAKVVKSDSRRWITIEYKVNQTDVGVELEGVHHRYVKRKTSKNRFLVNEQGLNSGKNTLVIKASALVAGSEQKAEAKIEVVRVAEAKVSLSYKTKAGPGDLKVWVHCTFGSIASPHLAVPLATGKAPVTFKAPVGTTVKFRGKTWKSRAGKDSFTVTFDVLGYVWKSAPARAWKSIKLPIEATSPAGRTWNKRISISGGSAIRKAFLGVAGKPILAPGEKPSGAHKALLKLEWSVGRWKIKEWVGKASQLRDVSLVAFVKQPDKVRKRSCGTYRGRKTGKKETITNNAWDKLVTVYDRRTGKIFRKKLFKARIPPCRRRTTGGDTGVIPEAKIDRWLKRLVK